VILTFAKPVIVTATLLSTVLLLPVSANVSADSTQYTGIETSGVELKPTSTVRMLPSRARSQKDGAVIAHQHSKQPQGKRSGNTPSLIRAGAPSQVETPLNVQWSEE